MLSRLFAILSLTALIITFGCSSNGTPVVPNTANALDSAPVISLNQTGDFFNAVGLMGAYDLTLNPETLAVDLVSKRHSTIGEGYIVSGLGFFTMVPCSDCLNLIGLDYSLDTGIFSILFELKHPFAPGNPAEPPTAANRLDLNVFDTAAVIVANEALPTTYALLGADIFTGYCLGADGYTTELGNVADVPAGALPYYLVVDDSESDPLASTFNEFAQGDAAEFEVGFDVSAGAVDFTLLLTMGYGASAKKLQRLTPKYYNPEFNRKAAWKVEVMGPEGDLEPAMFNTWDDNSLTDLYDVTVNVYDWQAGAVVTADPLLFADATVTEVFAASEVASVTVEIPGMTTAAAEVTVPTSGTGAFDDPLVYTVPMANELGLAVGEYLGLVKVLDGRAPAADWATEGRDFVIDSPDGIALNNYNIAEYATYQTFTATVVLGCGPITGQIDLPAANVDTLSNGDTVDFEVSASSANGGDPITLYEMDLDYDGTTFTADDSNATGLFPAAGPFINPNCGTPPEDPVTFTVAFRATDSCDPPATTMIGTLDVTVDLCCPDVTITGTSPECRYYNDTGNIAITGTGFTDGPDLECSWVAQAIGPPCAQSPWISTTVVVNSDTSMDAYLGSIWDWDGGNGCPYAGWDVDLTVTNGCGNVSTKYEYAMRYDFSCP